MANRVANPRVLPVIVERWSTRAFDESVIATEDLNIIFEAAGFAPSAFNFQPWRFLYARRDDENWQRFLSLLVPFNAGWAKDASVLIFILSDQVIVKDGTSGPSHSHSFDAGAAWAQMALQATAMGYHAHAMSGVDFDRARIELGVPDQFRIEAAAVIGRRGDTSRLPEMLRERETPSGRKAVNEIAYTGNFR